MKTSLAFLLLLSVAQAQNLTSNIPYADPAHERQVLDIYAPDDATDLPVVFWIHGGGWQTGDKTSIQIKPRVFAERGFVFVSTNYRLLPHVEMGVLIRDVCDSAEYFTPTPMGRNRGSRLRKLVGIVLFLARTGLTKFPG